MKLTGFEAFDRFPEATKEIVEQVAKQSEFTMKKPGFAPYLSGNLRRSIISVGSGIRWQVSPHTAYANRVNEKSSSPQYIERTTQQTLQDIPEIIRLVFQKYGLGR